MQSAKKNILVVEDNSEISILIAAALYEYQLTQVSTIEEAFHKIKESAFHLILLDLGLPDGDGMNVLSKLKQEPNNKNTPVFIVSTKTEISKKVMAFSIGADDFIVKPFDPIELQVRIAAKLKKIEQSKTDFEEFTVGDLLISVPKQKVWHVKSSSKKINIDLTSLEFKLLLTFSRAPEIIFSRDRLLDLVWGDSISVTDRTVDTHVGHLRRKIQDSSIHIETVIGSGYRLTISS